MRKLVWPSIGRILFPRTRGKRQMLLYSISNRPSRFQTKKNGLRVARDHPRLLLEWDVQIVGYRASEDKEGWTSAACRRTGRDIPEYIQISIKKPKQNTIRSDHFFFCEITITSPFVSVSVSESFLSGTVDLVGPADIDFAFASESESTIVFVGESSSGVGIGIGNALEGIIGSI
jgi:hypothetical protein